MRGEAARDHLRRSRVTASVATYTSSALVRRTHDISATYTGDANFGGSTGSSVHVVSQAGAVPPPFVADTRRVLLVTSLADGGAGSLRDMVRVAAAGDEIRFAVTGAILLNQPIVIDKPLTIAGPGSLNLVLDGRLAVRPLAVLSGGVTMRGVKIANGLARGGNGGSGFAGGGGAGGLGGGAFVDAPTGGDVIFQDVEFWNNEARGGNGGDGLLIVKPRNHHDNLWSSDFTHYFLTGTGGGGGIDANHAPGASYSQPGSSGGHGGILGGTGGPGGSGSGGEGGPGAGGGGAVSPQGRGLDVRHSRGGAGGYGGGGGAGHTVSGAPGYGGGSGGAVSYTGLVESGPGWGGRGGQGTVSENCDTIGEKNYYCSDLHAGGGGGGGGAGLGGAMFVRRGTVTIMGGLFFSNRAVAGQPRDTPRLEDVRNQGDPAMPAKAKGGGIYVDEGVVRFAGAPGFLFNVAADAGSSPGCIGGDTLDLCHASVANVGPAIVTVSGSGQQTAINTAFPQPLRLRVYDNGMPAANAAG